MSVTTSTTLIAACLMALACLGGAFEVKRCDGNQNSIKLLDFSVDSCPDKSAAYCEMVMQTSVKFNIKFHTSKPYAGESFYSVIEQKRPRGYFETPASVQACNDLGLKCPIVAGGTYSFANHFYMREDLVSPVYRFALTDEDGDKIVCLEIPTRVVKFKGATDDD